MAQRAQNRNESPSRRALTYGLTEAGRISSLAGMNGTVATTYADNLKYGAAGFLLRDRLADGVLTENRSYNWLGQMTLLDLVKTDSSHPLTLTWDYGSTGDNGNLLSHTTNTGTRTFTQFFGYDAANRLRMAVEKATVTANLNSVSTTCNSITAGTWPTGETCLRFGYDSFGNGWNEESRNANGLRFQGHNWYLIGSTVSNRIKDLEYDSAGNLRQLEPANPLSPVANYDGEGRIYELGTRTTSSPTAPVTPTAQYYYNGEGQRVKRVVSGVTTYYVYGLDGAVAQEYTDGTVTATGRQYLIADHLGSTRLVLDGATLQAVARYDYEPYGTLISRTGEGYSTVPGPSPFLFTGKERDMETAGSANPSGLDYFGARYMSAAQGRWTSPDPYLGSMRPEIPQSFNRYAYVLNSPTNYIDPDGYDCAYLNSAGDDLGSVVESMSAHDCTRSGGYWVSGRVNSLTFDSKGRMQFGYSGTREDGTIVSQVYAGYVPPTAAAEDTWRYAFGGSLRFLWGFLSGSGATNRDYDMNSAEARNLTRSAGFRQVEADIRNACAAGQTSGQVGVGTFAPAKSIPTDIVNSPVGGHVGARQRL